MAITGKNVKRRWRRTFRRGARSVEEIGQQADKNIDRLLFRRLSRLALVRRFVVLWLLIFGLLFVLGVIQVRGLSNYYQVSRPAPGGIYSEGIVGLFTNANPLYANGAADTAVSQLVFSGLLKYDQRGRLTGDLADSWQLDKTQTLYTVQLRQGLKWHDGKPFTSADVVFTYNTIQNIEAQSPHFSSWQGITVKAAGPYAVTFSLLNPLSSFPYSLIGGIVPEHLLRDIPPAQLRSASFNTEPIGTGPFEWKFITVSGSSEKNRQQQITLAPNNNYWAGRPKLDAFDLSVFASDSQMIEAFGDKQINAMAGLDHPPANLVKDTSLNFYNTPLNAIVMAFFNNSQPVLKDKAVRMALVRSVDHQQLISLMDYPANLVNSPLLPDQQSYINGAEQLSYSSKTAETLLDEAGWKKDKNGQRYKDGKQLILRLVSENTSTYSAVAQFLQQQWSKVGVKVDVSNLNVDDLQGSVVPNHDYDILLYGIHIGVDPDVFVYWDSSQASTDSQGHLNLSEYKSDIADQALQSARTRPTMSLRIPKYQTFLRAWRADAPALALYQPNFLYVSHGPVYGYERRSINDAAERFYNAANWMIREERQTIE